MLVLVLIINVLLRKETGRVCVPVFLEERHVLLVSEDVGGREGRERSGYVLPECPPDLGSSGF